MAAQEDEARSNDTLKKAFRKQHENLINHLNTDDVIHQLYAAEIITTTREIEDIQRQKSSQAKVMRLVTILERLKNSQTYIELRKALLSASNGNQYQWLVRNVDKYCDELEQSKAPTVTVTKEAPTKKASDLRRTSDTTVLHLDEGVEKIHCDELEQSKAPTVTVTKEAPTKKASDLRRTSDTTGLHLDEGVEKIHCDELEQCKAPTVTVTKEAPTKKASDLRRTSDTTVLHLDEGVEKIHCDELEQSKAPTVTVTKEAPTKKASDLRRTSDTTGLHLDEGVEKIHCDELEQSKAPTVTVTKEAPTKKASDLRRTFDTTVLHLDEGVEKIHCDELEQSKAPTVTVTKEAPTKKASDLRRTFDTTVLHLDEGETVRINYDQSRVNDLWSKLFGNWNLCLSPKEYYEIKAILGIPIIEETDLNRGYMEKLLPYLVQKIKMQGCRVLQANRLYRLLDSKNEANNSQHQREKPEVTLTDDVDNNVAISRIDCVTCLMNAVELIVASDLLNNIAQFPMAIPLVVRDFESGGHKVLTSLLRGITIKWECNRIIENSLFIDPYQIILAVRVGDNSQGKSTILNQLFNKEFVFSSKYEPGADDVKPETLDGSVEFVLLLQEICSDSFWEELMSKFYSSGESTVYLLANLHGNVVEHMTTFSELCRLRCKLLVFRMPGCTDSQFKSFSDTFNSDESMYVVNVDPERYDNKRQDLIQTSGLHKDYTRRKVRNAVLHTIDKRPGVWHHAVSVDKSMPTKLHIIPDIKSKLSSSIVDEIRHSKCISVKNALTQLDRSENSTLQSLVPIRISDLAEKLLSQFALILTSDSTEREQALWHLEKELYYFSNIESQQARARVLDLKRTLRKKSFEKDAEKGAELDQLRKDLASAVADVDTMNFGLEHLYRSLEKLYAYNVKFSNEIHVDQLPTHIAELVKRGHSIELINGDENSMPISWLNDIFSHVDKLFPRLKVFVVSVIGLQSSGKSTLLNSLFACRFAVSVGRCSRGLFMRLLLLDQDLPHNSDFNAILVIDTEGLGSPEGMNDSQADKKDRLLATFAMGISNLTIVNVLGENMKELAEILQIAVVTMARLGKVGITPDILMVQHLLTENNPEKTSQAEYQFGLALKNAIDLTQKEDVQVGVQNSACLSKLYKRTDNETLLMQFHTYKDGASANSSPSEAYHNDVVKLYQRIIDIGMLPGNSFIFKEWYEIVEAYWGSVTEENFALCFKNVREVYDFIERGRKIESVKQEIDSAFRLHENMLCDFIESQTKHLKTKKRDLRQSVENYVKQNLSGIPATCESKCDKCQEATELKNQLFEFVAGKASEYDTQETISRYEKLVFDARVKKLMQIFESTTIRKGCSANFDEEIRRHLSKLLSQAPGGKMQRQQVNEVANEVFLKLAEIARTLDDNVEAVRMKIKRELSETYQQVADFCQRFDEPIDLEEIVSAESEEYKPVKRVTASFASIKRYFANDETKQRLAHDLIKSLKDIPTDVIQAAGANSFQSGLTGAVYNQVNDSINSFTRCFGKISHNDKYDVHVGVQQLFCKRMEVLQEEWDKKNRPSMILSRNKNGYMNQIKTRLKYGFNIMSEGLIMAQHLKRVVNRKAMDAERTFRINSVKDLVWITNSEKVRLKYFTWLAEKVSQGQKKQALFHFEDPRKAIEEWFLKEIDSFQGQNVKTVFINVKQRELNYLLSAVKTATSFSQVSSLVDNYSALRDELPYRTSYLNMECTDENFIILRETILTELQVADDASDKSEMRAVALPSADDEVLARLGCTARCVWCGALCWGQRGHDRNTDDTKKHHSSHQPRGLALVSKKVNKHLISLPCHETPDETMMYFGTYTDSGLPWKIARDKHFSDWKFDRHYNVKFDELMRWFFQELHVEIAKSGTNVLPAEEKDLCQYGCSGLELPAIMARIKTIIS